MNESIVTLSITTEELKYAEIFTRGEEGLLRSCYHGRFSRDEREAVDLLRRIVHEKSPLSPKTFLVISSQDLIYKEFVLPFVSPKKVSSAIRFEVSSEYTLDDYVLDWIEGIAREPGRRSFLAALAWKETLRKRIQAAEDAGLQIMGITSDLSSLGNCYRGETQALVMDVGEKHTLFSLFAWGVPELVRDIPIGIGQIRRGLEKADDKDLRALVGEMKRTVHSFNARADQDLGQVQVSGSILLEPLILDALRKGTDLEIGHQAPPHLKLSPEDRDRPLNAFASILGIPWGKRKGKSFNFLKDEFSMTGPDTAGQSYFRWAVILVAALLFALLSSSLLNILALKKRDAFLANEIRSTFVTAFPETKKIVDAVKQARNLLNARLAELGGSNPAAKSSFLDVLEILSKSIPQQTNFEIMTLFWEKGKVEIGGKTDSFKSVNAVQEILSKSGHFTEVVISNAKSSNDGQTVEFTLTIRFEG